MNKKTVLFDFDGTIVDTLDPAIEIYNKIADEFNCRPIKPEEVNRLRSQRPQDFMKSYGVTILNLIPLLLRIRKEIRKEIANIKPSKGIMQALGDIKNDGFNMGVVTSNSAENVNASFEANSLTDIFSFVHSGRSVFGKSKQLKSLLKKKNLEKDSVVYVGDETRDVEAAKKAGIPIVAVGWGFNTREILETLNPDKIVDDPSELLGCLRRI